VGEVCEIEDNSGFPHLAEVIGFRGSNVLSMPVETTEGIRFGDTVAALGVHPEIEVGPGLMGRVLNALGKPIDEGKPPAVARAFPLEGWYVQRSTACDRTPLGTGIRVLDGLLTVGRGQRVGIFGGSGVGKSTLIGMMTRNTAADVTLWAGGERGREVVEFLDDSLGAAGRRVPWWWFRPRTSRRSCACAPRWRLPRWRSFLPRRASMCCWCWIP